VTNDQEDRTVTVAFVIISDGCNLRSWRHELQWTEPEPWKELAALGFDFSELKNNVMHNSGLDDEIQLQVIQYHNTRLCVRGADGTAIMAVPWPWYSWSGSAWQCHGLGARELFSGIRSCARNNSRCALEMVNLPDL
jgi:hypothetical protein